MLYCINYSSRSEYSIEVILKLLNTQLYSSAGESRVCTSANRSLFKIAFLVAVEIVGHSQNTRPGRQIGTRTAQITEPTTTRVDTKIASSSRNREVVMRLMKTLS